MADYSPVVDKLTQLMLGEMQQPMAVGTPQYEIPAPPQNVEFFTPMQQGLMQAGAALSRPLTMDNTLNMNLAGAAQALDTALSQRANEEYAKQLRQQLLQAQVDNLASSVGVKKKDIRKSDTEMNLRRAQTIATLQDAELRKEAAKNKAAGGKASPVIQEWRTLAQTLMALNPERYKDNPALAMHDAYKQMKLANKKIGEGPFGKVMENMIFALGSEEGRNFLNEMLKMTQQYRDDIFAVPGAAVAAPQTGSSQVPAQEPQIPVDAESVKSWIPKVMELSDEELQKVVAKDFNAYYAALMARGKKVPLAEAYANWLKYYGAE